MIAAPAVGLAVLPRRELELALYERPARQGAAPARL